MFRDIGIEELLVIRKALSGEEDKPREQIDASKAEAITKAVDKDKGSN